MATGRILAVDDAYSVVVVHYEDGEKVEFSTWSAMIDAIDLNDAETINFFYDETDTRNQDGGVAPLTAYPVQGGAKRPDGQGCITCRYKFGCLATEGMRGEGNAYFSDSMGTACSSWSLKVR